MDVWYFGRAQKARSRYRDDEDDCEVRYLMSLVRTVELELRWGGKLAISPSLPREARSVGGASRCRSTLSKTYPTA